MLPRAAGGLALSERGIFFANRVQCSSVPVVDGRDVELRGQVSSESEARRAERIVRMVRGVRVVRMDLHVAGEDSLGGGET